MKSQVTVFVIIVLVAIVVSSIMFSSNNKKQIAIIKESEDVNLKQITPIKIYFEQAMQKLLLEGYFLIGRQGGKIYKTTWPDCQEEDPFYKQTHRMCNQSGYYDYGPPPKYLEKSPYQHKRVAIGINHTRIDLFTTYSSDEPLRQPFAYPHVGKVIRENYQYGSQQPLPPITSEAGNGSIESQLGEWISDHLLEVMNMSDFERMGYDITLPEEKPKVTVEINEEFITVKMYYKVQVVKGRVTYNVEDYYTQIKSSFREFYGYINDAITQDVSTKSHMMRQALKNVSGRKVAGNMIIESIPNNFMYDIVNFSIGNIDYQKNYNFPERFLTFYMIRENRPSDAGTVKIDKPYFYYTETATWFCINMKTGESPFDPDEDDDFSKDPFPWTNPVWYYFYSRGDNLITTHKTTPETCSDIPVYSATETHRLHIEPHSKDYGSSFLERLTRCGNADDDVSTTASELSDVGDLIILKTSDQQSFTPGGDVLAPSRYPDPPILEDGTGRLNDVMSWRPVKCKPSDGDPGCCGADGYWRFMQRPDPEEPPVRVCLSTCETKSMHQVGTSTNYKCECDFGVCTDWADKYRRCNQEGKLVEYPDYDNHDTSGKCTDSCP